MQGEGRAFTISPSISSRAALKTSMLAGILLLATSCAIEELHLPSLPALLKTLPTFTSYVSGVMVSIVHRRERG